MNKRIYLDCKKLIKKFIDRAYWQSFNSGDIFYFVREGKPDSIFTFVENMADGSFGGQLFSGAESFNYVHDILTTNSNAVTIYDCNALIFSVKTKEEMTEFDKDYFKENKMRVMPENNFLAYRYFPGKMVRMANDLELKDLYNHLAYINSIVSNEFDRVIEAFANELCIYSIIDDEKYTYEMILRPLPYLETKERNYKKNDDFILEFKDKEFINSECYLFLSYAPLVIKEKGIRPLMVYFYYPKENKHLFRYIMESFYHNKNMLYGILDEAFNEIGKPYKMYINNRLALAYLHKTLDALNIENVFLREEKDTNDNIDLLMSSLYRPGEDEIIEEQDIISSLMDVITKTLNTLNEEDFIDQDEIEEKEELIS